jgi:hypothetical protein
MGKGGNTPSFSRLENSCKMDLSQNIWRSSLMDMVTESSMNINTIE